MQLSTRSDDIIRLTYDLRKFIHCYGTTYGVGNRSTTFNVSNSRVGASVNINPTDTGLDTLSEKFGTKTHILTLAEIPAHSNAHCVTALSGGSAIRYDYNSDASGGAYDQGQ